MRVSPASARNASVSGQGPMQATAWCPKFPPMPLIFRRSCHPHAASASLYPFTPVLQQMATAFRGEVACACDRGKTPLLSHGSAAQEHPGTSCPAPHAACDFSRRSLHLYRRHVQARRLRLEGPELLQRHNLLGRLLELFRGLQLLQLLARIRKILVRSMALYPAVV